MYSLTLIINGETIKKRNADIEKALMSAKPELVFCEMYVTATKDKRTAERRLPLIQARKLFNDDVFRQIFLNNLLIEL
jgi:hypothetical protein